MMEEADSLLENIFSNEKQIIGSPAITHHQHPTLSVSTESQQLTVQHLLPGTAPLPSRRTANICTAAGGTGQ